MQSLNIGLVAYGLNPAVAFVRVPNERGRWMLVDRSVVEVDCPHCKAVAGEPCRQVKTSWRQMDKPHDPIRYGVGVHVARKQAWAQATGHRFPAKHAAPHKPRLRPEELAALTATLDDLPPDPEGVGIDVPVTPKADLGGRRQGEEPDRSEYGMPGDWPV